MTIVDQSHRRPGPNLRYVYQNGHGDLLGALDGLADAFASNLQAVIMRTMLVQSIITGVDLLVILLLGVTMLRPVFKQIASERVQVRRHRLFCVLFLCGVLCVV